MPKQAVTCEAMPALPGQPDRATPANPYHALSCGALPNRPCQQNLGTPRLAYPAMPGPGSRKAIARAMINHQTISNRPKPRPALFLLSGRPSPIPT
jgi:hypothetical protein